MTLSNMLRLSLLLSASVLACAAGCGDDDKALDNVKDAGSEPEPEHDAEVDVEEDAGEPDCYTKPKTYVEIINTCTDAEYVDKDPVLPQLLPDGTLPPLP
jgi:hypothetical protein